MWSSRWPQCFFLFTASTSIAFAESVATSRGPGDAGAACRAILTQVPTLDGFINGAAKRLIRLCTVATATRRACACEAANATIRSPGTLRAFGQRIQKRRGRQIAVVAVARKPTTLAWHMLTKQQDYIFERPALTFRKLRKLEMTAGSPARSNSGGRHWPGTVDNPAPWGRERVDALAIEADYVKRAANWTERPQPLLNGANPIEWSDDRISP